MGGEVLATTAYPINKFPSIGMDFKITMEIWSGKTIYYSIIKVSGALEFGHIKQDVLYVRVVNYLFIVYLKGVKEYKLLKMEIKGFKFIISINFHFYETRMRIKCKDLDQKCGTLFCR